MYLWQLLPVGLRVEGFYRARRAGEFALSCYPAAILLSLPFRLYDDVFKMSTVDMSRDRRDPPVSGFAETLKGTMDSAQRAALNDLYRAYFQELCGRLQRSFGAGPPEPEEAAQAAFMRYAELEKTQLIINPRGFLFTTARNIIFDQRRRAKTRDAYVADQLAFDAAFRVEEITPERVYEEKARFKRIMDVIQTLPEQQRVLLTMSRLHGKTYEEIRDETGWSMGAISRNLTAAKKALSAAMKELEDMHGAPGGQGVKGERDVETGDG